MFAEKQSKGAVHTTRKPDARVLKMRALDDHHNVMVNHVKAEREMWLRAEWEKKTDAALERTALQNRYAALRDQAEAELDLRRQRVARKLGAEEAALQWELQNSAETSEQRREKMVERARRLQQERECERQAFAEEALYQAWREGCDPLRLEDQRKIIERTIEGRNAQLEEKYSKQLQEQEEKRLYDEMYENERLKKEERYLADKKHRKALEEEAQRVLGEQVQKNEVKRQEVEDEERQDAAKLKSKWEAEEAAEQAEIQAKKIQNRQVGEELLRLNIEMQEERAAAEAREQAEDTAIVQAAVLRARQDEDREIEMKARQKEEARVYRQHLMKQMHAEAEDTADRDRLIQQAEEMHLRKRQEEEENAQAAREKLLHQVLVTREAQIREKQEIRQLTSLERDYERQNLRAEMDRIAEQEAEYTHRVRMQRVQNQMDIQSQIRQKENMKAKEKLEGTRAHDGAFTSEKMYQHMIATDNTDPKVWHGRKATKWYT